MEIQAYGKSEKGLHLTNQDAFIVDVEKGVFAVADGVTISRGKSEKASQAAVSLFHELTGDMESIFQETSTRIQNMDHAGTTTLTAVRITGTSLEVGHVGDSALFLVRNGVRKITEDDAQPRTNVLTQVMGRSIRPHLYQQELREGDVLLLATDGVAKYVSGQEILEIIASVSLEKIPSALISCAKEKKKLYEDDKTVVVVRV